MGGSVARVVVAISRGRREKAGVRAKQAAEVKVTSVENNYGTGVVGGLKLPTLYEYSPIHVHRWPLAL
jgi:hypothetical protein